ncbi:hypothetical protein KVQ01_20615 [Escherichia coli]|uniref:hypothetical protein n=1 Tax=Escherichia coli TaxID=562 RepID=UPI001F0701D2|nr:hypothetical protein [Escherichia coli]MCH0687367.1 hypothetical protein [Escherichia coli]
MTMVCVQYNDAEKTKIIAVFSCPQDKELYPNQGEENTEGILYQEYLALIKSAFPTFIP